MPSDIRDGGTVDAVAEKEPKDPRFEARFRAHVRRQMDRLGWGPSMVAAKTGFHQGYVSNWLLEKRGKRGASALFLLQMCAALGLDPMHVFKTEPEERFWRPYAPRQRGEDPARASPEAARPTRRTTGAGGRADVHPEKKAR